ncbi:MAG TPA: alpha/beta fold hydrolase [Myxococcales bacterium]
MEELDIPGATARLVHTGEVHLHCVEAGAGPLVLLLHGFPEFWWSWRFQIPALAAAGFRVVAPDLRGYHLSDQPSRVADYRIDRLVGDVVGLMDALGEKRASVVGHDWGGLVAWAFAMAQPARLRKLAILNVPHPRRMLKGLLCPRQLLRSWYVFFFQLPWVPERFLAMHDYAPLRRSFRADELPESAIDRFVDAARASGLRGGIDYYRAALRHPFTPGPRRIDAPVLVIWGERDRALRRELAEPDPRLVPNARVVRIPGATHWVQQDAPERVNALLTEFLRG